MKWRWNAARSAAGKPIDRPNVVYGADVHVVWGESRYFEVEARRVPLARGRWRSALDYSRMLSCGAAES